MLCPKCKREMTRVLRFEPKKSYQFYQCECGCKTKNKRIHFEEFYKPKQTTMKRNHNERVYNNSNKR